MRFSVFLAGALAVIANAQDTTSAAGETAVASSVPAPTVATPTYSLSPEQSSQLACVEACDAGDVDCQSHCVPVPSPNDAQANATNECAAKCDQGDGSEADTIAYGDCVQGCIKNHYYETSKGTPNPTGGSDSGSGSGSGSNSSKTGSGSSATGTGSADDSSNDSSATGTGRSSGTATGTNAAATSTNAAAAPAALGAGSFVGLAAAIFAL